jgi:hypothetical protein
MGIDIKNSFHVIGLDRRGAIVLRQKWSRGQIEARLAAMPCLIGVEACVAAHHLSHKLQAHGHDARLMPAKYVRAYSKSRKTIPRRGSGCRGGAAQERTVSVMARRGSPSPARRNIEVDGGAWATHTNTASALERAIRKQFCNEIKV